MKAVNYYVVVDKIKNEQKKVAGLIMTEDLDQDNRYSKGKVVSVGNLVEGVTDGDTIRYDKHAGHAITWKDTVYYVIKIQDVIIVE
uniref:Co-chaperonin GroES n=1 Tax=uncultured virus TaxID=340016 RepID=A0A221S3R3_9VIRU|nr:co-chaperonin GroES [uncultured virus]